MIAALAFLLLQQAAPALTPTCPPVQAEPQSINRAFGVPFQRANSKVREDGLTNWAPVDEAVPFARTSQEKYLLAHIFYEAGRQLDDMPGGWDRLAALWASPCTTDEDRAALAPRYALLMDQPR
jgi:hypothetical protein